MTRGVLLWLVLFGVYAATLGLRAGPPGDYGAGEARRVLLVESIVSDRDVDLADEYRTREWRDYYDGELTPARRLADQRANLVDHGEKDVGIRSGIGQREGKAQVREE